MLGLIAYAKKLVKEAKAVAISQTDAQRSSLPVNDPPKSWSYSPQTYSEKSTRKFRTSIVTLHHITTAVRDRGYSRATTYGHNIGSRYGRDHLQDAIDEVNRLLKSV